MIFSRYPEVAVAIVTITSLAILVSRNWRQAIIALVVQYIGMFWLTGLVWPLGLSAIKLVVGWMAGALLGATQPRLEEEGTKQIFKTGRIYRLLVGLVMILIVFATAPNFQKWMPASIPILQGSIMLIAMGLIQIGLTDQPFRVFVGLLTMLSGMEVLYAVVERSVLVAGLMAIANLGLALAGSYLVTVRDEGIV